MQAKQELFWKMFCNAFVDVHIICCCWTGQVKSGMFGKDLEKVSEYGAQEYPGVSPVCLLFSGCHYDLLMQKLH